MSSPDPLIPPETIMLLPQLCLDRQHSDNLQRHNRQPSAVVHRRRSASRAYVPFSDHTFSVFVAFILANTSYLQRVYVCR